MRTFIYAAILALMPVGALSQDWENGFRALNQGDYETALQELRPLAEQGHAGAQYNLGVMYNNGQGVTQDYAKAVRWYCLAAKQGDAYAQNNLGVMYFDGKGVKQDNAVAAHWYRLAAEQGEAAAQYNLGKNYARGEGVVQDYVTEHMWLNIAGANGADGAAKNRDIVANRMTAADISKAQRRARVCIESGYQDCD